MKFLISLCILLAVFYQALGGKVHGNEFFDELLDELRDADDIRVMTLDDLTIGFSRKVALLTVHGEAKLYDGTVTGLDTAERIDDAQIITRKDGSVVIRCTLGMGVIIFNYKGTVSFMGLGPSISMLTHTGYVTVKAEVQRAANGTVKVTEFNVRDFEKLKVKFTGLGPLTWATSLLIAPAVNILTPIIRRTVEYGVRTVVEKKLPDIIKDFSFE
ncbi:uncharacterized protein LOC100905044 [Galendromus occidentalis]|uniref:Uncharacterized protein LOC100905044 n=1 Tax=Galendromus occidentalis TaxID=34638 RepID=A0AAJ6QSN6_9ACAR|nr:uncharacterized protein LOC100905044 [Galendromus occidentalis]